MSRYRLTLRQARKLALASQGIHRAIDFGHGKSATLNALQKLAYIQIDTISVIERAHHHVLWSRVPDYQASYLEALVAERQVFEYWSHAAAYLPMRDFRYSLPQKQLIASGAKHWYKKDAKVARAVLDRIAAEGPLQVKDFEHSGLSGKGGWGSAKPAKIALECLFMEGVLMISARRGFNKVYELSERVIPQGTDLSMPTSQEYSRHLIRRYLMANGLATPAQIVYLRKGLAPQVKLVCQQMLEETSLIEVEVDGCNYYALPDFEQTLIKKMSRQRVKILSPFDNLLIQRKRMSALFDFNYQLECYLPATKRNYGYFVLPLLWGQQFAGRMDVKIDRKSGLLFIKHLSIETVQVDEFTHELQRALKEFLQFNGGRRIKVEHITQKNDLLTAGGIKRCKRILEFL